MTHVLNYTYGYDRKSDTVVGQTLEINRTLRKHLLNQNVILKKTKRKIDLHLECVHQYCH